MPSDRCLNAYFEGSVITMNRSIDRSRAASRAGFALAAALALVPQMAGAGEGGTTHVIPGATATLVDNAPTASTWIVKPMYLHYDGKATVPIPTAAGLAGNLHAKADTFAIAVGRAFETKVLGATYTAVAALPFAWIDVSANVQARGGTTVRSVQNSVSGFGDLTVIPALLAWKEGDWQFNAMLPVYAPTGSYKEGRLGNPGLNYWTFDPAVGVVYSNAKSGFNALLHMGYAMNTENNATNYKSGDLLHFDGAVQQVLPVGSGYMTLGAEGFYFQQTTCDSGSGAVLGCFKGRTAGLGPVAGYILPLGKTESLLFELKWLPELDTKNRLDGDYIWLKMVYKF
jgi:hypothetical protein